MNSYDITSRYGIKSKEAAAKVKSIRRALKLWPKYQGNVII